LADSDAAEARLAAFSEIAGDPILVAILDYWQSQSREGLPPRPRDIDPILLPPAVLPYVTLLDVVDGGAAFNIRLVGSANVSAAGRDFTGKRLDTAMLGDLLAATSERYCAAVTSRRPVVGYADYAMPDGSTIRNVLMTLPMSSDGVAVDRLLSVFRPRSEWLAQQALRNFDSLAYRKPVRSYIVL
jgi:hypothetical protein